MTVYTKSMMETLAEVRGLQEDNIDLMRKAAGGSMQTIKMKDGKLKMDKFTASAIMQVYDKVNPANQKKMTVMINKGTKDGMLKLQSFAMKQVKSSYGEETDLGEGFINIGGAKVKDDEKSILQHIKKTFPNVKKVRKDPQHGWIPVFEEDELDEGDPFMRPTKGKEKVVTIRHKTSGKELSVTANSVKKYEKMGYKVVKETTEIGKQVAEQLAKIRGNTPADQGRRAATKDDLEDAEEKGDKKLVKKLKEGKMKELHSYIKQGKSAEWIAKKMGVDAKTIKALIGSDASGRFISGNYNNEAYEVGTDEYRKYTQDVTPGEVDEASARADAMRAMRKGKDVDPADVDTDASDADVKAASKNIMMQMRKVISLGGRFDVEFLDKKKVKVKPAIANAFIKKYQSMRRPADKEKFQNQAMKSYKDLLQVLKSQYMAAACNGGSTASSGRSAIGLQHVPQGEVGLAESLPSHLQKHFDRDGNPKSKEGKAAWERIKKTKMKGYTPEQIKMAIGVAFDKRYVQGNMTGAAKTIEKIAKGLSDLEPVRDALRRANEDTILDRIGIKLKERKNG